MVVLLSLTLGYGRAALATPESGWDRLGTTLLQPIAEGDALPNSAIPMALEVDAQGFLWVGTQNGLARWDGLHFKIYNAGDKPGDLPDSMVDVIHTDRRGRLWIGTPSRGLSRFDPRTETFSTLTTGKGGLSHLAVHALADASNGDLWIGTEGGLDRLAADGRISHVTALGAGRLKAGRALSSGVLAVASNGSELWIGTHTGLLRLDERSGEISLIHLGPREEPQINAITRSADGTIWVGTEGHGAYAVIPATGTVRPLSIAPGSAASGLGVRVRAIAEVRPGEIWLGTYDDGIFTVDPKSLEARPVRAGNGSLLYADRNIRALLVGPSGLTFIAANNAITRFDPRGKAFSTLLGGEHPTAVLSDRNPVSLFEAPDHKVWVGFMSHGIDRIDADAAHVEHLLPRPGGLPKAPIRTELVLPDGKILIGTDTGLYLARGDGTGAVRIAQPGRAPDARVQALQRDGQSVWLSGRDGLWRFGLGAGDRLTGGTEVPIAALSDRRIDVTYLAANGDLWIGTDNGLNRLDRASGKIERFTPQAGDEDTPQGFISSISLDSRGRLWVTTFGRGLSFAQLGADGRPGRFHRIDVAAGLPNANVNQVLEDARGYIWASTDSGLARIEPNTLHLDVFRSAEGVPVSSFFYAAGTRLRSGELLFAGRGGVVVVHPERVKPLLMTAPLVVTSVRLPGQVLKGDPFLGLARGEALKVAPGAGGFEVGFAALDYHAADRIRYAYRLIRNAAVAWPEPWTETDSTRPTASFTNLSPGEYRLEIRAADPGGAWRPQSLVLPVRVMPAWFQTWWFTVLEFVIGLLAVAALIWWRTSYLHHRRRELELMVDERTQALRTQTEVLEAQTVTLAQTSARAEALAKAKSDFLANMSHEIRTPLNGVVAVAEMLSRSALGAKEREMAEIIRASGDTLQRLLSDILDTARIESGKIAIEMAPFQPGPMIRSVAGLSQLKCDEKGVRLAVEIDPDLDRYRLGDLVRVRQVVTNLLSNAVKFTDRGEVRITARPVTDRLVRIEVSDTGVGFSMADKAKVLGRFEQADSSITRRYGGSGLGLSICCDLAAMMGGTLDCDSAPGEGSRFWLELPLELAEAAATADDGSAGELHGGACDRPHILLADDHPTNRKVVELMLSETDADLVMVENGLEALDAFKEGCFDIILMDMQMPVMDGLTAIRQIRALEALEGRPRTPIVMLTANALPEHVASAHEAGADAHLAKPITAPALFQNLTELLAAREPRSVAA